MANIAKYSNITSINRNRAEESGIKSKQVRCSQEEAG